MSKRSPQPVNIKLHQKSKILEVEFDDDAQFELSCEYLRVFSPSAEVRGHGSGQSILQTGKENVSIEKIEPIGNYAIKLVFDDGHSTGLYTWDHLYELGVKYDENWMNYLEALRQAGHVRQGND